MAYQVERIIINAVGAHSLKFVLSVPSGEETDSECSRSPSGQQVPYCSSSAQVGQFEAIEEERVFGSS